MVNPRAAARVVRCEAVGAPRVLTIPNGIDLTDRPLCHAPGRPRVLMVANLRPEKGHDVPIDAAPAVLADHPDAVFRIVGDGPLRERLVARVREEGLADAFEFLGHREDVPRLLASAGVFVQPSWTEALPNAVMEAMAARLPIVASEVGGIPELIEHGRSGLLVPPGDGVALARAIGGVLDDRRGAAVLGAYARRAVEGLTLARMVEAFEDLYQRGVDRARPAAAPSAEPFHSDGMSCARSPGGSRTPTSPVCAEAPGVGAFQR